MKSRFNSQRHNFITDEKQIQTELLTNKISLKVAYEVIKQQRLDDI
jgi:hypothetical protein